jgi:hypothetical protein
MRCGVRRGAAKRARLAQTRSGVTGLPGRRFPDAAAPLMHERLGSARGADVGPTHDGRSTRDVSRTGVPHSRRAQFATSGQTDAAEVAPRMLAPEATCHIRGRLGSNHPVL